MAAQDTLIYRAAKKGGGASENAMKLGQNAVEKVCVKIVCAEPWNFTLFRGVAYWGGVTAR